MKEISGRNIAASLNPRPLALIGAQHEGEICFATIAWVSPISHTPPLCVFALRQTSRTFQLLAQASCCSICVPDEKLEDVVRYCGTHSGNKENKAERVPYTYLEDTRIPSVKGSVSTLLTDVESIQERGDHMLVIASVRKAYSRARQDEEGNLKDTSALLCLQRNFFTRAKD